MRRALRSRSRCRSERHCAQTHLVIVSGLGGEAKYIAEFNNLSQALADAANKRFGIPRLRFSGSARTASRRSRFSAGSRRRSNVEHAMSQLAASAGAGDQIVLVLIGHGSGEGPESKISIPGPDLGASDFAQLLAKFPTQKVAFINLTSASGDMLPIVSGAESRRHHGDEERLRAKRVALRAVLRRRVDQGRRRHRQGRPRLAARGVPLRGRRDEALLRQRHEAADGARAARRRRREDRRTRSRRPHGAGRARASVLPRRRDQRRRRRERSAARRALQGEVRARGSDRPTARSRSRR